MVTEVVVVEGLNQTFGSILLLVLHGYEKGEGWLNERKTTLLYVSQTYVTRFMQIKMNTAFCLT